MEITQEVAQMILDALAWSNLEWYGRCGTLPSLETLTAETKMDFIKFTQAYGIETVTVPVVIEVTEEGE